jgi:hypothetical protein
MDERTRREAEVFRLVVGCVMVALVLFGLLELAGVIHA